MKRALSILFAALSLWSACSVALAQSSQTAAELARGQSLMQSGNLDGAERSFTKAHELAAAANDKQNLCQAAFNLGILQTALHKTKEAEKSFQEALMILNTAVPAGTPNPFGAAVSCMLADLYLQENKAGDSIALYEKYIPQLPATPPTLAAEKTINLAHAYELGDKFEQAQQAYEKGIAAFTTILGPNDPQTLTAISNYATFLYARDQFKQSAALAEKILQSKNVTKEVEASSKLTLSHDYNGMGQYGKAMKYARETLNDFQHSHATDIVNQATALLWIGRVYKDGSRYVDAGKSIEQAMESLAKNTDGAEYSDVLREKADLFIRQGQYEKAEPLLKQSKAIRERFYGPEHSDIAQILSDQGYVDQQKGRYADAETAYKRAIDIYTKARGEQHHLTVDVMKRLADLYRLMNKTGDAAATTQAVLNLQRSSLPPDSPEIARTMLVMGQLYEASSQTQQAEKVLHEAIARDKSIGAAPAQTAASLVALADVQAKAGKRDAAAITMQEANKTVASLPGGDAAADIASPFGADSDVAPGKQEYADKWCLSVGISNFKNRTINLKYAAKDATDFQNFLVTRGNFKPDHVKLLTDESATRQNLIDQLGDGWLANKVKPDDLVVVYISSHGSQAMDDAKGVNFLVAYDTSPNSLMATGIPMQWLSKIIQEQVKCKRTIILLDVCHSGSAADWSGEGSFDSNKDDLIVSADTGAPGTKGLSRSLVSDPQSITPGSGQIIVCSSSKAQTSWESVEYPNSVFTKRLIDALISKGDKTSMSEAFAPLRTSVETEVLKDRGAVQTPQISGGWKGSPLAPLSK
jgi:tetratricopeptide (TPR) repeat protein